MNYDNVKRVPVFQESVHYDVWILDSAEEDMSCWKLAASSPSLSRESATEICSKLMYRGYIAAVREVKHEVIRLSFEACPRLSEEYKKVLKEADLHA